MSWVGVNLSASYSKPYHILRQLSSFQNIYSALSKQKKGLSKTTRQRVWSFPICHLFYTLTIVSKHIKSMVISSRYIVFFKHTRKPHTNHTCTHLHIHRRDTPSIFNSITWANDWPARQPKSNSSQKYELFLYLYLNNSTG